MHRPGFAVAILLVVAALFAGCASKPEKEKTEREIYTEAKKSLARGNFKTAQDQLQELETRFPFGRYSGQSQFDMIYAQMRGLDYPAAAATAARVLRQDPSNPHNDYVLYVKGLANYWMQSGVIERRSPTNPALRDLSSLRDAYGDFATLLAKYPQSEFAPDARARMLFLRNQLAEQDLANAWYYVRRGACVAALNRAAYVIANYPTTPRMADALAISSECSRRLGEVESADRFLAVLKFNFPQYPRLKSDGKLDVPEGRQDGGHSLLNMLSFGLLDSKS